MTGRAPVSARSPREEVIELAPRPEHAPSSFPSRIRMNMDRVLLGIGLAAALFGSTAFLVAQAVPPDAVDSGKLERLDAGRGLELVMDGDLEGAFDLASRMQRKDPQSPVGYLLESDATWWKIYYSTGDLIDPDVFDVAKAEATPYDSHLDDLINAAISKSDARIRTRENEAYNVLYQGLAYAVRARFNGLRGKDLPTARAGKKMRSLMLRALQLDPTLTDAYSGLGIYNYYVDTLPAIIKFLRFFIALPGGNRELGLEQLRKASEQSVMVGGEAKFYLAKNFSRQSERQYAKSLELFQELAAQYPHNPLWPFVIGSLRCRLGQTGECDSIYRQVLKSTAGQKAEVMEDVHRAARQALERMHPNEKLD